MVRGGQGCGERRREMVREGQGDGERRAGRW